MIFNNDNGNTHHHHHQLGILAHFCGTGTSSTARISLVSSDLKGPTLPVEQLGKWWVNDGNYVSKIEFTWWFKNVQQPFEKKFTWSNRAYLIAVKMIILKKKTRDGWRRLIQIGEQSFQMHFMADSILIVHGMARDPAESTLHKGSQRQLRILCCAQELLQEDITSVVHVATPLPPVKNLPPREVAACPGTSSAAHWHIFPCDPKLMYKCRWSRYD